MPEQRYNLYYKKGSEKVYVLKNVTADEGNNWYKEYTEYDWRNGNRYANGVQILHEVAV